MKNLILILLAITFIVTSCDDNDSNNYIWYDYSETQCADAWETGIGSTIIEVETAVGNYLDNLNVNYGQITVNSTGGTPEACEACHCLSGRLISVKADPADDATLTGLNFVQQ